MVNKKLIWIILGVVLLGGLIFLIETNNINTFDTKMYELCTLKMNDLITNIFKIFTFLGSTLFMVSLCVILFFIFIFLKKKNISFIIASALIISTIVNNIVKLIIRRPRPEVLRLVTEKSFSFPSGHTMASVTMYGILIYIILKSNINKSLKIFLSIVLGLLPILVGISRIYLGAHFASDVIGAALTSGILLLIEIPIINKNKWLGKGIYEKN